jgi:hypothetical protein
VSNDVSPGRWFRYSVGDVDEHPGRSEIGDDGGVLDAASSAPVVGLGAICGLRASRVDDDERSQRFWVAELAVLAKGRRVILHEERGFTIGSPVEAVRGSETEDTIVRAVLNVVLPDDDDCEDDHPWPWLAELARARGLEVTGDDLRGLPYEVVLTESLHRWLSTS